METTSIDNHVAFFFQVKGKVQKVGFRNFAIREAKRLGLYGWVRNTADGDVKAWAEGLPEQIVVFLYAAS